MKTYSIMQFNRDYPNDDVCLDELFNNRYGELEACPKCGVIDAKFYRVKARKCYACEYCGHQLHPTAGTIFHKSDTPLTEWFFALYLFSNSKNGVSAKELERHLAVTYKTAWRIARQIRLLMHQNQDMLSGIVEADEAYIGGKHKLSDGRVNKTQIIGAVERDGKAKAIVVDTVSRKTAEQFIEANIDTSATMHTDNASHYRHVSRKRVHEAINHAQGEYARGDVNTNTIEGFWSQMKRCLDGTYHSISPKHLQLYVDEFVYRYNHRLEPVYPYLIEAAGQAVAKRV